MRAECSGKAEYLMDAYPAAEKTLKLAPEARKEWPIATDDDRRDQMETTTYLALAVNAQHRVDEAEQLIVPVLRFHRELAARIHGDQQQHLELARTLYAQALIDPTHGAALLRESARLIDALPSEILATSSARLWRNKVRAAL